MPAGIGRVLRIVRKLVDYGKRLAEKVQQHAAAPGFGLVARRFGTTDLALILARITAGLQRAAALETVLCQRADQGRELVPVPNRAPVARAARAPRQDALPKEAASAEASPLADLPSAAAIAAEIRRRPVGAVIADICRDLGLTPSQCDKAFWQELSDVVAIYGGSLVRFFDTLHQRLFTSSCTGSPDPAAPGWMAASLRLLVPRPP